MAWALIGGGATVALLGLMLLTRFGLYMFKGEVIKDMGGWGAIDIGSIDPANVRKSLSSVWKENPRLAAQIDENLRSFEEVRRSQPDAQQSVQHLVRVMYVARYVAMALVLLGVAAVATGVWLRAS